MMQKKTFPAAKKEGPQSGETGYNRTRNHILTLSTNILARSLVIILGVAPVHLLCRRWLVSEVVAHGRDSFDCRPYSSGLNGVCDDGR